VFGLTFPKFICTVATLESKNKSMDGKRARSARGSSRRRQRRRPRHGYNDRDRLGLCLGLRGGRENIKYLRVTGLRGAQLGLVYEEKSVYLRQAFEMRFVLRKGLQILLESVW